MAAITANNNRIARNTAYLYVRMLIVLVVSLYTSRVVINTLGVSDYGIYNVVGGFVTLFSFLNATLASSMQRFYNYDGGLAGEKALRVVYSTGFWIHIALATAILILLETFGIWYINNVMVIPEGRMQATNIVYQCSIVAALLAILQIPYTSAILAMEKMDFYAVVSIIDVFIKLAIVIILPHLMSDKLITFSVLTLGISITVFLLYFVYSKKSFGFIKLTSEFDISLFKRLMSFSIWNLIGFFALLLRGQGLNLILNGFFGTVVNAARGVAYQVNNAIVGFSRNINTAFAPQVTDAYAKGEKERVTNLMFFQSKVCFCLLLVLIVPVVLEIDTILRLWLGKAIPEHTDMFTVLVLIDALVHTLNPPISQVAYATGNIKNYQIANAVVNILLLPVCWALLKLGMNPESTFIATIVFSIIYQGVSTIYLKKIYDYSIKQYCRSVLLPCLYAAILLPLLPLMVKSMIGSSVIRLLILVCVDVVVAAVIFYGVILNKSERKYLISKVQSKMMKS